MIDGHIDADYIPNFFCFGGHFLGKLQQFDISTRLGV
jgi:hypothetical protein